ncbi:MAG: hypothetical protein WDA09_02805 [Bacteriovoracaceae bacterium]
MNIIKIAPAHKLQLKVFGHHIFLSEEDKKYYQIAYESWKQVWQDVQQQEMGLKETSFYSDEFTRQDHIIALFDRDNCVGIAFMREIDLDLNCIKEDSSFRFWPKTQLLSLNKKQNRIVIATSFTITPQYRRGEIEWKTLFLSLYLDYFSQLQTSIMVTAARKVKSNEKLCYQLGAKPLMRNVPFTTKSGSYIENEIADLLYWEKNTLSLLDKYLQYLRNQVWSSFLKEKHYDKILSA